MKTYIPRRRAVKHPLPQWHWTIKSSLTLYDKQEQFRRQMYGEKKTFKLPLFSFMRPLLGVRQTHLQAGMKPESEWPIPSPTMTFLVWRQTLYPTIYHSVLTFPKEKADRHHNTRHALMPKQRGWAGRRQGQTLAWLRQKMAWEGNETRRWRP